MGIILNEIAKSIPSETTCVCPCNAGIISSTNCDNLVVSSMCDWGVYGLLTYLAIAFRDIEIVPEASEVRRIMQSFAKLSGLVDPKELITDGIPYDYTTSCLEILRGIAFSQLQTKS
jgi:D-glutamate cyclase